MSQLDSQIDDLLPPVALPTFKLDSEERPDCGYCERPSAAALVEIEEGTGFYIARCMACIEFPAEGDEPRYAANGKPAFTLTVEQRRAIFAGDHTSIKLEPDEPRPNVEPGQKIILATARGGKQFLAKTDEERYKLLAEGADLLIDVPSEPSVWVVLKEPVLRNGRWTVPIEVNDVREPTRTLAAAPTGNRQPGLKTRLRKRVSKKGEVKPPSLSDDAARGYGGGGKSTVDEREGIDDTTLGTYARLIEEENKIRQSQRRSAGHMIAEEMRAARMRRDRLVKPEAERAVKRRAERAAKRIARVAAQKSV